MYKTRKYNGSIEEVLQFCSLVRGKRRTEEDEKKKKKKLLSEEELADEAKEREIF
jgi:hypothetical protein